MVTSFLKMKISLILLLVMKIIYDPAQYKSMYLQPDNAEGKKL